MTKPSSEPKDPAIEPEPVPADADAVLVDVIEQALPEVEKWSPAARSDRSGIGHGARQLTLAERAERIAARVSRRQMAPVVKRLDLSDEQVRAAQEAINTLFAAYFARNPCLQHPSASAAVGDLVERAEDWVRTRADERGRAVSSELMTQLPTIYQRFLDGIIDAWAQEREVTDLFARHELRPADDALWNDMLDVLVFNEKEIRAELAEVGASGQERRVKGAGAVETAAFGISRSLDALGVSWPHKRSELIEQRKMSDQERAMGNWPAPFGTSVGPAEAVASAERAAFGAERGTTDLRPAAYRSNGDSPGGEPPRKP